MPGKTEKVSFVFPVCNEEENLDLLYQRVKEAVGQAGVDYEMIFVDDGSLDNSLDIIKSLRAKDPKVSYISLSRNFGHQNAIFAGLTYATGDAVITMDADLQHPPSFVPKMIALWQKGAEVVYTFKEDAKLPFLKNIIVRFSYRFISKVSGLRLNFGQSDFRLIDKKVLRALRQMPEYHKFLRGQVEWIGFRQKGLSYTVGERHGGKAKYSYRTLSSLALNGIFSFSRYPLHLVMIFSLSVFLASAIYILIELSVWLLKAFGVIDIPMLPGWTTLIVSVFFLGSIQLMAIGLIGEYVGRIYDQTKGRPSFIIREMSDNEDSK